MLGAGQPRFGMHVSLVPGLSIADAWIAASASREAPAAAEQHGFVPRYRGIVVERRRTCPEPLGIGRIVQDPDDRLGQCSMIADLDQRAISTVFKDFAGTARAVSAHH